MHMQTRPEYRGELGWREALAAKRLPRSGVGGPHLEGWVMLCNMLYNRGGVISHILLYNMLYGGVT